MDPVIFLVAVLLGTIILSPILGAESRPGFRNPNVKPRQAAGSMRPSDWPPSEFKR